MYMEEPIWGVRANNLQTWIFAGTLLIIDLVQNRCYKLQRLGYTESYSETQNYKYCFFISRIEDDAPDTSGTLDTIVEETDNQVNDEVAVDAALDD